MTDNWSILGIPPNSTEQEIKSAFRKKALQVHPDVGGSTEDFKRIYSAYEFCLRSVEPRMEIDYDELVNELFKGGVGSLVGMKVRFTFDPTSPNYHYEDHRTPNELGGGD